MEEVAVSAYRQSISSALLGAILGLSATVAEAAKIDKPRYDLYVWGIPAGAVTHPLAGGGVLLASATEADAVGGGVVLTRTIGHNSDGSESFVQAGVANDGDLFSIAADTPNNFRLASYDYIGSGAEVLVYQSYRKDSADAKLTYTYTFANLFAFVNPEFGPLCPLGDPFCLRAEMISRASVVTDPVSSAEVWSRLDSALVTTNAGGFFISAVVGDWPWALDTSLGGGLLGNGLDLPESVTREVDLSAISLGEEFTVQYQLYGYAYDRGSHLGLERGASVFARDPLAGDTGVTFDIQGLTPTNNPILPAPVPVPAGAWLFGAGAIALLGVARRRRATAPACQGLQES
jgi:hypothetical protein